MSGIRREDEPSASGDEAQWPRRGARCPWRAPLRTRLRQAGQPDGGDSAAN
eukprot:CAMPEP_0180647710 /NCGR_PEP_ID=MMETSP1037_2-20121125/50490_1 /TAXON_ID=632150 /ORGANISM="Azadinium spinosum, Strain 3D9" /LENGTH=50 /DNA_ID=CAMNT_0022672297 /DNA_START=242 /DNA_END=391 /DNA_ORIENTATION=+